MSCCAVIVTYHPDAGVAENITALRGQVDEIFIVDNGSGGSLNELLGSLPQQPGVSVIYNQENLGIAAALNVGVKLAKAAGYEWVVTFDQDSRATPGMIATMLKVYDAYPEKEKVASLSPRYLDEATGRILGNSSGFSSWDSGPYKEQLTVMTSGNMVKTRVFDQIGYFNEALFIDRVDHEFCLRCFAYGYKTLEIKDAILVHGVGFPTHHKLLWMTIIPNNHSALRRYYFARNSIYMFRKYLFIFPMWVLKNALGLLKVVIVLVLFETDRKRKIKMICQGVLHGLCGKSGKLPE